MLVKMMPMLQVLIENGLSKSETVEYKFLLSEHIQYVQIYFISLM